MDILYNQNLIRISKIDNNKILNNFHESMKILINIYLNKYFNDIGGMDALTKDDSKKEIKKKVIFLFKFIFKYFDFCLLLLYNKNQTNFFEYMVIPENIPFQYYQDYKILTMEAFNKNKDYKEQTGFIYYLIELISINNSIIQEIKNDKNNIELPINQIYEYKFKYKSNLYDVTFQKGENMNNEISNYNKIVVLCLNDNTKKFYFQDIIDFNSHLTNDNIYKLRVNNNIYLIPLKNIDTYLYSIENEPILLNEAKNSNDNITNKITKYENIPKYSWNFGYDGNKYLLLSEEDNQVYSFYNQQNYYESMKDIFKIDIRIGNINSKDNKIINFINGAEKFPSFAQKENGDILFLNENKKNFIWLKEDEKLNIESPISIQVKIKYISATYNECYLIGTDGNLYESKERNFIKINLPKNTTRFLQCSNDSKYVICLVQNKKGQGVLYSKGSNDRYQCGIREVKTNIKELTKCDIDDNFDFKFVTTYGGFSAALTKCGNIFIWDRFIYDKNSLDFKTPLLINSDGNSIIYDSVSIKHDYLYAIGRKLENGNYIKKIFYLKPNLPFSNKAFPFIPKEFNIIDKEEVNSRIIPIKIFIGKYRTYFLCIKENNLIEEIIKNNNEKEINNNKVNIKISYEIQPPKFEHNLETMKTIYTSDNLNKFNNSFNSLSNGNIKDIIKVFDEIDKNEIKVNDIDYNEFITYLQGKEKFNNLLTFFLDNEKSEGQSVFTYLKTRKFLIEKNLENYFYLKKILNSESFINEIIEKNIIYLNDKFRIKYFRKTLVDVIQSNNINFNRDRNKYITIDRFKAINFKEKFNENIIPDIYLSETIFGQLFRSLGGLNSKEFLKEMGKKLFRVDLKGERAIDAGGPYHEILSDACDDLQTDYIELLIKTPNNKSEIGEDRDKYIINPNCNNTTYKKALEFIGKLMALAISSGETLNFNLHSVVWKTLLEIQITFEDFKNIDFNFYNWIKELKEVLSNKNEEFLNSFNLYFTIQNSNDKKISLIENGDNIKVTLENLKNFIDLAQSKRLEEITEQIKNIKEGLYSAIEKGLLKILNWEQLENMVCGEANFDMKDFKKNTKCDEKEEVIQWFWKWLEKCKKDDKFKYLKFVSGRSRLPKSKYQHIIHLTNDKNKLPTSHTCFFTLDLPRYDSKKILYKKMKYAIENSFSISDS